MSGIRRGLLGGSFDPPHMGHLLLGAWALATGEIDRLLLVPCHTHALDKTATAAFADRVALAEALAADLDPARCTVSDIEGRLGPPCRTLRTLQALTADHPGDAWRLVIGQDIVAEAHRWHRWDAVAALAPPLVAGRAAALGPPQDLTLPDVSSTEVRRRLAAGQDATAMVPGRVRTVIAERGLYR
jgi:nicotinate-nucleotide adenylyltransferase